MGGTEQQRALGGRKAGGWHWVSGGGKAGLLQDKRGLIISQSWATEPGQGRTPSRAWGRLPSPHEGCPLLAGLGRNELTAPRQGGPPAAQNTGQDGTTKWYPGQINTARPGARGSNVLWQPPCHPDVAPSHLGWAGLGGGGAERICLCLSAGTQHWSLETAQEPRGVFLQFKLLSTGGHPAGDLNPSGNRTHRRRGNMVGRGSHSGEPEGPQQ